MASSMISLFAISLMMTFCNRSTSNLFYCLAHQRERMVLGRLGERSDPAHQPATPPGLLEQHRRVSQSEPIVIKKFRPKEGA
jgi:hypothetical protein